MKSAKRERKYRKRLDTILNFYKKLIQLRKELPVIANGTIYSDGNVETIRVQGDAFHLESINSVEKESIEVRIRNSTSTEIKLYEAIPVSSSPCKE